MNTVTLDEVVTKVVVLFTEAAVVETIAEVVSNLAIFSLNYLGVSVGFLFVHFEIQATINLNQEYGYETNEYHKDKQTTQ